MINDNFMLHGFLVPVSTLKCIRLFQAKPTFQPTCQQCTIFNKCKSFFNCNIYRSRCFFNYEFETDTAMAFHVFIIIDNSVQFFVCSA